MRITEKLEIVFKDLNGNTQCISKEELQKAWENYKNPLEDRSSEANIRYYYSDKEGTYKTTTFCAQYNREQEEETDPIVESVKAKFDSRSSVGRKTYATTLFKNNKDNYLKHLQDELMDSVNYIEKMLQIKEDIQQLIKQEPNDESLGKIVRAKYNPY